MLTNDPTDEGAAELTKLMAETKERWRRTAEFADLVDEYEQVTRCQLDELEDAVCAHYEVGLTHRDYWLRSLRRLGEAVTRSPSLIQCAEAPEGAE